MERSAAIDAATLTTIIADARSVAIRYFALTGKPLGITGEIGEYEAARLLGLTLADARACGYDAVDVSGRRLQIKARWCSRGRPRVGERVSGIDTTKPWDAALLVLLDAEFRCIAIYEADRDAIVMALDRPGSRAPNERRALGVRQFTTYFNRAAGRRKRVADRKHGLDSLSAKARKVRQGLLLRLTGDAGADTY